jgi:hypothetical protein
MSSSTFCPRTRARWLSSGALGSEGGRTDLTHFQGPGSEVELTQESLALRLKRNRVESRVHRLEHLHHRYERVVQMICRRIGVAQKFTRARTQQQTA